MCIYLTALKRAPVRSLLASTIRVDQYICTWHELYRAPHHTELITTPFRAVIEGIFTLSRRRLFRSFSCCALTALAAIV